MDRQTRLRRTRAAVGRGFSVIEMLIALTISSMLLTACLVALDGSFKAYEVTTDSAGQVKLRWTLGREPGTQRLTLRLADDTASVTVTAQATPGAPAALAFISPPATRSAKALAAPLVVEVTDRFGNPVPGVSVTFSMRRYCCPPASPRV